VSVAKGCFNQFSKLNSLNKGVNGSFHEGKHARPIHRAAGPLRGGRPKDVRQMQGRSPMKNGGAFAGIPPGCFRSRTRQMT